MSPKTPIQKCQESTGGDFGATHWVRPSWALSDWGAVHIGPVPGAKWESLERQHTK
jgi:hypothetical protein